MQNLNYLRLILIMLNNKKIMKYLKINKIKLQIIIYHKLYKVIKHKLLKHRIKNLLNQILIPSLKKLLF